MKLHFYVSPRWALCRLSKKHWHTRTVNKFVGEKKVLFGGIFRKSRIIKNVWACKYSWGVSLRVYFCTVFFNGCSEIKSYNNDTIQVLLERFPEFRKLQGVFVHSCGIREHTEKRLDYLPFVAMEKFHQLFRVNKDAHLWCLILAQYLIWMVCNYTFYYRKLRLGKSL